MMPSASQMSRCGLTLKRDVDEVKNYRDALYYITKFIEKKQKITVKTILEIHRLTTKGVLDKEKSGKFRQNQVYVVSRRGNKIIKVSYTGPIAKQVPKLVKNLVDWMEKSKKENICPIIISGIAHAEIAAIHPFADGNGRTARLLATLILYKSGYDFRRLFALEDYYNQDRPSYYKAIHLGKDYQERAQGDLTDWITYFSHGFAHEMEKIHDAIIPLSLDAKMLKKIGGHVYLDKKQIKIMDFVMTMNKIERSDVEDILNVSKRTAIRLINSLLKTGLLKTKGEGKKQFYVLSISY